MPETEIAATMGYLTRALKTPTIGRVWETLGDQVCVIDCLQAG